MFWNPRPSPRLPGDDLHPLLHRWASRVAIVLVVALILMPFVLFRGAEETRPPSSDARDSGPSHPPPPPTATPLPPILPLYGFPTAQTRLKETDNPEVYMPTGSGRVESALFGATRTNRSGLPQFHEGVDIAPIRWSRQGRAEDEILAVADGKVAYLSRSAGNSSYGVYLVLTHEDPVGEFYSLYAHLASIDPGLRAGQRVVRGQVLGIMGNTSTLGIPHSRSHLHFEIGLMLNRRFDAWYRRTDAKNVHGSHHGFNLFGIDPLLLLTKLEPGRATPFSMLDTLQDHPYAWRLVLNAPSLPEVFQRHPLLWQGAPFASGALVVEVSEGGVPLRARQATPEEALGVTTASPKVLDVQEEALGRNALRHVLRRNGAWRVTDSGRRWIEMLLFSP